jgi:hypothetical protein
MGRMSLQLASPRRGRMAMAVGALATLALGTFAMPAAAADDWADFGEPTTRTSFEGGVTFQQAVTVTKEIIKVELLIRIADSPAATIIEQQRPFGTGPRTLTHILNPLDDGHLLPNTPLSAQWRLTGADPADVAVSPEARVVYEDDRFAWLTETGALVRVHWYEGSDGFGAKALGIAEDGLREASELLGVTETDPVDFFVYADQDAFYDALGPGTRENVGGQANAEIRTLFALISPNEIDDSWVGVVIPHELVHLVFDTAAKNPYHFPPRWLNEGLAVYQSQGYGASDRAEVERAASSGTLIPLDGVGGQFPTSFDRFSLAYAESVAAVDYFIRAYEQDALVSLIRSYAQGRTDDEAFQAVIGKDMAAFGEEWLSDLGAQAPTRYGPQPAPPGPIPAAWQVEPGASAPAPTDPATPTGGPSATPAPGANAGNGGVGVAVILAVAAVLVIGLGAVLVRRGSRSRTGNEA